MAESLQSVLDAKFHRNNSFRNQSNIETKAGYTHDTLPEWLTPYVQNPSWGKRWAVLLNMGHEREIHHFITEKMGEHIKSVFKYINTAWSRANMDKTLEWIRKEMTTSPIVAEVAQRIKASAAQMQDLKYIVWKWGRGAIRYAALAQEDSVRNRYSYFRWLTSKKGQETMRQSAAAMA